MGYRLVGKNDESPENIDVFKAFKSRGRRT